MILRSCFLWSRSALRSKGSSQAELPGETIHCNQNLNPQGEAAILLSREGVLLANEDSLSSVKPVHTYLHHCMPVDLSANNTGRVTVRRPAVSKNSGVSYRSSQPKSGGLSILACLTQTCKRNKRLSLYTPNIGILHHLNSPDVSVNSPIIDTIKFPQASYEEMPFTLVVCKKKNKGSSRGSYSPPPPEELQQPLMKSKNHTNPNKGVFVYLKISTLFASVIFSSKASRTVNLRWVEKLLLLSQIRLLQCMSSEKMFPHHKIKELVMRKVLVPVDLRYLEVKKQSACSEEMIMKSKKLLRERESSLKQRGHHQIGC
ncbi:hypothetical protein IGI04_014534 [Brassica rapa subsp. trilocularis]|uniref:Uncharacterized protein n=1 Tax=Brassica rapa subsp. trilocularis TaxID=1813537 RepID=A0ABQ7MMK9_BRACM|nr:hypothetical protein IGI04_014534 [Brassica rapa subsp. trilocularis]